MKIRNLVLALGFVCALSACSMKHKEEAAPVTAPAVAATEEHQCEGKCSGSKTECSKKAECGKKDCNCPHSCGDKKKCGAAKNCGVAKKCNAAKKCDAAKKCNAAKKCSGHK